ncbi:LuxR C-terminal-related transcriptional regulator [Arthrobacter ginkgonis]
MPEPAGIAVPRERIAAALDGTQRLTILRAPAFAGKTFAVAQWVRERMRAGGADAPGYGWWDTGREPTATVDTILAAVEQLGSGPRVLVLDHSGLRAQDPAAVRTLAGSTIPELLARCPKLRIILTTRHPTSLELAAETLPFSTRIIRLDELAFTAAEVNLLGMRRGYPESALLAERLQEAAQGLPGLAQMYFGAFDPGDPADLDTAIRLRPGEALARMVYERHWVFDFPEPLHGLAALVLRVIDTAAATNVDLLAPLVDGVPGLPKESTGPAAVERVTELIEALGLLDYGSSGGLLRTRVVEPWRRAGIIAEDRLGLDTTVAQKRIAHWAGEHAEFAPALKAALAALPGRDIDALILQRITETESLTPQQWFSVRRSVPEPGPRTLLLDHLDFTMDWAARDFAAWDPSLLAELQKQLQDPRVAKAWRRDPLRRCVFDSLIAFHSTLAGDRRIGLEAATRVAVLVQSTGGFEGDAQAVADRAALVAAETLLHEERHGVAIQLLRTVLERRASAQTHLTRFRAAGLEALALALAGFMERCGSALEVLERRGWPADWLAGDRGTAYRVAKALFLTESGDFSGARILLDSAGTGRAAHMLQRARNVAEFLWLIGYAASEPDGRPLVQRCLERLELEAETGPAESRIGVDEAERKASMAYLRMILGDVAGAQRLLGTGAEASVVGKLLGLRLALAAGRASATNLGRVVARIDKDQPRWQAVGAFLGAVTAAMKGDARTARESALAADALCRNNGLSTPWLVLSEAERGLLHQMGILAELHPPALKPVLEIGDVPSAEELSDRETEVLRSLVSHRTLQDVADDLHLSLNTVKTHVRHIYRKLGVASRSEALLRAAARGIVDGPGG